MAKKKCPDCPSIPAWMTTFSDLMSLLLTFFVLLLTMASMDKTKLDAAFGILNGGKGIFDTSSGDEVQMIVRKNHQQVAQDKALETIQKYMDGQNMQTTASIVRTNSGFTIRLLDSVLFAPGSAEILPSSFPVLTMIADLAEGSPYFINIEGHTDDQPSGQFSPVNWDVSNTRALNVLKFFLKEGVDPKRLASTGFGEYHPLLPNITESNRAQNRRVEINFVDPEFYEASKTVPR